MVRSLVPLRLQQRAATAATAAAATAAVDVGQSPLMMAARTTEHRGHQQPSPHRSIVLANVGPVPFDVRIVAIWT